MRCSRPTVLIALLALHAGQVVAQAPAAVDARLSPDGRTVVARATDGEAMRLVVVVPGDSTSEPRWITPPATDVGEVDWTPDGTRVVYRDAEDGHLYIVSTGSGGATPQPRDLTPDATGLVRLAGFADDAAALVELSDGPADFPDLYRVALSGGAPELVLRNEGGVARWVVQDGAATLAVLEGEEGEREIARIREGRLVPFYVCGDAAVCEPVGFHPDGRVWVRSSRERDAAALILVDPLTLATEVVRPVLGIDTAAFIHEDSTYTRDLARLEELLGDAEIGFHGPPRASESRMLVTARGATDSALYLFDRWAGTVTRVLPLVDSVELGATGLTGPVPDATLVWPERLRYSVSDGEPGVPPTDVRRRIRRRSEGGRAVIEIVDETEVPVAPTFALDTALLMDPDYEPDLSFSVDDLDTEDATDTTVLDATTLRPIRRRATGPFAIALDFGPDGVRGTVTLGGFETDVGTRTEGPVWTDGAGLELLVGALPLAESYETQLTYFDAGLQDVVTARLSVGEATRARTQAGEFEAWRVRISPRASGAGEATWWVSRAAPHVLLRAIVETRDYERTIELIEGVRP